MNYWNEFLTVVADLLETESVQSMWNIKHHLYLSCFEHSVFVAYISYCTARRLGRDSTAAARAGLLHDFYLYDSHAGFQLKHYFTHASCALENAREICELSQVEENIILAHMWPFSAALPKSGEAFIVCLCDKYCAMVEGLHIWHHMKIRRRIPAAC